MFSWFNKHKTKVKDLCSSSTQVQLEAYEELLHSYINNYWKAKTQNSTAQALTWLVQARNTMNSIEKMLMQSQKDEKRNPECSGSDM